MISDGPAHLASDRGGSQAANLPLDPGSRQAKAPHDGGASWSAFSRSLCGFQLVEPERPPLGGSIDAPELSRDHANRGFGQRRHKDGEAALWLRFKNDRKGSIECHDAAPSLHMNSIP
jgi:hypothetical protein